MINRINGFSVLRLPLGSCIKSNLQTSPVKINPTRFDTVSFTGNKTVFPVDDFEFKEIDFKNNVTTDKVFDDYLLQVHNRKIAKKIKEKYTSAEFNKLFKLAKNRDVFKMKEDLKTHFIRTCDSKDDKKMGALIWVTDTCNFMPYLKDYDKSRCTKLVDKLAEFYTGPKEQEMFDMVIANPCEFQKNYGRKESAHIGVGHVFDPNSLETDAHYPRTRLESVGLFLQTATDLIMKGVNDKKSYGYKNANAVKPSTAKAIANCTAYLKAINYPYSKSTGPWEQWTFDVTPSSDVAVINQAFRNVLDLMYKTPVNNDILKIRELIRNTIHGNVFDKEQELRNMLRAGEERIKTNSLYEVPEKRPEDIKRCSVCIPPENAEILVNKYQKEAVQKRHLDGAMSFIFKTEKLDDDVVKNAEKVIERMQSWEYSKDNKDGIIFDHGVIRYPKDQYLFVNQNLITNKKSSELSKIRYSDMNLPVETQAQWFMVSDISKSYGVVAKSLINYIKTSPTKNKKAEDLLKKALKKETEFINRSYARITGTKTLKANGTKCPAYKVPEAYQCVEDKDGNKKFVPGVNTPLTWAQVSLYDASKMMLENLKEYEALKL